ncbi:MAG: penicillin-binding transpeptidase domain-containing protein [Agathobacter sp.]|nr:penicillin-binding transpeptidase domain-containing protein [Agathobacter sp.]
MKEIKKQKEKQARRKSTLNREFSVITYFFFFMFLALMIYFVYFQVVLSENFINSPYNSLQDLFAGRVVRGEILTSDGKIIAQSEVDSEEKEKREYPYGRMFAHAVGYSVNGKAGIENQSNFDLLRSHQFFLEQIVNDISGEKSIGDNVITTLDYEVQETAYNALGDYDGAVIVLEPSTGKILGMVSKPDFDPNTISQDWDTVNGEGSTALYNRATQGQYTPGSVFKIFTALEYYREHTNDYQNYLYDCSSEITVDGSTIHCYSNEVHGEVDINESFAESCNSSFANIGLEIDNNSLNALCDSMLFNTNIPISFETSKSKFSLSNDDSSSMTMETCIGQGKTMVSPLHMALVAGAVCNDGKVMRPYIVDRVENLNGTEIKKTEPVEYKSIMSAKEADFLEGLMAEVVEYGTGSKLSEQSYNAYGKTGTAQVSDTTDETNAWFVGYAKKQGYNDIAIAVIVEDSGTASRYAVPIAKKVFDAYFN